MNNKMKTELEIEDFLTNNSNKINSLCRICLSENAEKWVSLFENQESLSFSQKVMLCTRIQIHVDDGLPSIICEQCSRELDVADNFRMKCEYSDSLLKKIYNNGIKGDALAKEEVLSNDTDDLKDEVLDDYTDYEDNKAKCESPEPLPVKESTPIRHTAKQKKKKIKITKSLDSRSLPEVAFQIKKEMELSDETNQTSVQDSSEELEDSKQKNGKQKNKKFTCRLCNKPLSSSLSLEKHLRNMHSEEKNKTQIGTVSGFGPERRFHCTECNYVTRFKTDLICHVRRHTGEKPYQCDVCERSFAQHATLTNHKKTHSDTMYYTCAECGKQFKYKNRYNSHKRAHTDQKLFHCTICSKGLKSQKILEEHMNRHYNIKNFNCETCGSTFVTFSEMTVHSRIHGTEKRFQCNLCEYRTFVKASLLKHMRRHTGERPYTCEICDWACYTKGELKIHTRKHTKEKNYPCPVCQTKFMSSSGVNKHMVRTHGVKFKWSEHKDRRVIK